MAFNPFELQRQMLADFEKSLGDSLDKTMREPSFMELVAQQMGKALDLQALTKTQMSGMLDALGLPGPAMVEQVFEVLHRLETRVLDLEEELADLRGKLAKQGESDGDCNGARL